MCLNIPYRWIEVFSKTSYCYFWWKRVFTQRNGQPTHPVVGIFCLLLCYQLQLALHLQFYVSQVVTMQLWPGSQINSKKKALPCLFPPANFWGDKPGIVWWVIQHPLVLWSSALGIYWVLHRSLTKLCICQNSRFASKTLTFLFPFYLSAMCHAFLNLFIHPECALIHQEIRALWQVSWKT